MMQAGPIAEARMQAQKLYRQSLPGAGELAGWVAQGLLDDATATSLMQFNGYTDALIATIKKASYRGLNPRQMLRLIETDLFTASDIADELTFAGMRPVSQNRMLTAAPYLATASERSSLRAEYSTAYVAGLYSDSDLIQAVQAAEQNTDLAGLVLQRAKLAKLVAETKALEAEYATLYKAGLMTDPIFRANLSAIGTSTRYGQPGRRQGRSAGQRHTPKANPGGRTGARAGDRGRS